VHAGFFYFWTMTVSKLYGLVGKNIAYSFSRNYFAEKFAADNITDSMYVNFDIDTIAEFAKIIRKNPNLKGLNVTIPYKEKIIPFLDDLSGTAREIGAVNTIKIYPNGILKGFNTDEYGFRKSIEPLLQPHHKKALILGTGGASKAVAFALKKLNIDCLFVSRNKTENTLIYNDLNEQIVNCQIVINTTPIGTFPNIEKCPEIPYEAFTSQHIAYDLIYNPAETLFLKNAAANGSQTKNGLEMLQLQAKKAWEIWND
jgi:shikimate dehydrogenase